MPILLCGPPPGSLLRDGLWKKLEPECGLAAFWNKWKVWGEGQLVSVHVFSVPSPAVSEWLIWETKVGQMLSRAGWVISSKSPSKILVTRSLLSLCLYSSYPLELIAGWKKEEKGCSLEGRRALPGRLVEDELLPSKFFSGTEERIRSREWFWAYFSFPHPPSQISKVVEFGAYCLLQCQGDPPDFCHTWERRAALFWTQGKLVPRDSNPSPTWSGCITLSPFGQACEQQLLKWFWCKVTFADCGHRPKNQS